MKARAAAIGWLLAGLGLLSAGVTSAAPDPAAAPTRSPFADFQRLSPDELDSLQVIFNFLGPVNHLIEQLAFISPTGALTPGALSPFVHSEYHSYNFRAEGYVIVRMSPAVLGALVDSVATLPAVTSGAGDSLGYVSFALLTTAGKTRAFEIILGEPNAAALAGRILSAVARDSTAYREMTACAYRMWMVSEDDPKDVSAQVAFRVEPFRRSGRSDLFESRVRVTNTSHTGLRGRFSLIPNVRPTGTELVNATGWTVGLRPERPYLDYPLSTDALAPGATLEFTVRVRDDGRHRLELNPRLFAGWGVR